MKRDNKSDYSMLIVLAIIVTCFTISVFGFDKRINLITERIDLIVKRLPDNRQTLATECYVDNRLNNRLGSDYAGCFYEDGEKVNVKRILDEIDNKIKVKYGEWADMSQWIPKNKFYKYHTLNELSEVVNKMRRR